MGLVFVAFLVYDFFTTPSYRVGKIQEITESSKSNSYPTTEQISLTKEAKARAVASFLEEKVNTGGYNGCTVRVISEDILQCDLHFPIGTEYNPITNAKAFADMNAQIGLAFTLYVTAYVGKQKVCEYKYDPYSRTVTIKF